MRTLGIRMNGLRKLINLKCGPGAAIIPPEVSRIHMDFAFALNNGHMGPRKFWQQILPRLKYHNPQIPMIVNRHNENARAPLMTIYLRDPSTTPTTTSESDPVQTPSSWTDLSKATPPGPGEKTVVIDMKDKHSNQILELFLAETRSMPLKPTKEELQEIQSLEELKKSSEISRARVKADRLEKKREEDMLKRARAAGGMVDSNE